MYTFFVNIQVQVLIYYLVLGLLLVAGGRSNVLHIWDMMKHTLKQVIQLPPRMKHVQSLFFIPGGVVSSEEDEDPQNSCVLGALSQDGILRFISLSSCKPLFQLGSQDQVTHVHVHVHVLYSMHVLFAHSHYMYMCL